MGSSISEWIERYQSAARSDDPNEIAALFTEDAEYHTGPFDEPWRGRDEIVRNWIDRGDSGLEWEFDYEIMAADGHRYVIEGHTNYSSPHYRHSFSNVWMIDLAEGGRASLFREWWVEEPPPRG